MPLPHNHNQKNRYKPTETHHRALHSWLRNCCRSCQPHGQTNEFRAFDWDNHCELLYFHGNSTGKWQGHQVTNTHGNCRDSPHSLYRTQWQISLLHRTPRFSRYIPNQEGGPTCGQVHSGVKAAWPEVRKLLKTHLFKIFRWNGRQTPSQ